MKPPIKTIVVLLITSISFLAISKGVEERDNDLNLFTTNDLGKDWKFVANFGNVKFYWKHGIAKSSVSIKAENGNDEITTIKVKVSGCKEEKEMTFYSIKPGKSKTSVYCASMIDNAFEDVNDISIELLSAK